MYCEKTIRTRLDAENNSKHPKKPKKESIPERDIRLFQGRKNLFTGGNEMTKEEVIKILVLIESVYSNCIIKDETIQQWFQFCFEMDYEKVMTKLKNHIRKSPFPPAIADIAVFPYEENDFPKTLQEWMKKGSERIKCERNNNKRISLPDWLAEYAISKFV